MAYRFIVAQFVNNTAKIRKKASSANLFIFFKGKPNSLAHAPLAAAANQYGPYWSVIWAILVSNMGHITFP